MLCQATHGHEDNVANIKQNNISLHLQICENK